MEPKNQSTLWDIATGIVTAGLSYLIFERFELNIALMIFSPLPVLAGILRGKEAADIILKVIMINLLFMILLMAIMNGVFYLLPILIIALVGTYLGIQLRIQWPDRKLKIMGFLTAFIVFVGFMGFIGLPAWLDTSLWESDTKEAPEYILETPEGDSIKSIDLKDKIVVQYYWTTWCRPCKQQFPVIEKLYLEMKDQEDISFLVINPLNGGDTIEKANKFIGESGYELPFVFDPENITYSKFEVPALPHLVIIDKNGIIRETHTGFVGAENFYQQFQRRLANLR